MKTLLILLALAGLGTAACGDDSGNDGPAKKDASISVRDDAAIARADADAAARPQQIDTDKVGAACTASTAKTDCTGVGATCLTTSMLGDYPAGYCSATCEASAECGPNGGCPIADLLSGFGGLGNLGGFGGLGGLGGGGGATCYKKCTTKSDCRTGYDCASLTSALSGFGGPGGAGGFDIGSLLGPSAKVTYCMPPVAIPDGGVRPGLPSRDGGTVTVIRGMDAGF